MVKKDERNIDNEKELKFNSRLNYRENYKKEVILI